MSKNKNMLMVDGQKVYFQTSEDMTDTATNQITLIFTSPPYWNLKNYGSENEIGKESYEEYLIRMSKVWDECYRVSKDNAILAINIGSRRYSKEYHDIAIDICCRMQKWKLIDNIIWYIPNALPQSNYYIERLFDNKYENVLIFAKNYDYKYTFNKIRVEQKYKFKDNRKKKLNENGRCIGNVIRIPAYRPPNIKNKNYHIAAFPEELANFIIYAFSNEGDTILDPFLGSGTTLKVARNLKRKGIGFEINEEYKDLIESRMREKWEQIDFKKIDVIHSSNGNGNGNEKRRPDYPEETQKVLKGNSH